MAPIIRKPPVLHEKRALKSRQPVRVPDAATPPQAQRPVQQALAVDAPTAVMPPPVAPGLSEAELNRRLAEARQALEADMKAKLEALREAAREEGHAEGLRQAQAQQAKAEQQREAEHKERAAAFARLLAQIAQAAQREETALEQLAVTIAYEAICKVAGDTLVTPEGTLAVVRKAMQAVNQRNVVAVHLAPQDEAALRQLDATGLPSHIQLHADDRVALGGCIVESNMGELDARLEAQLRAILDAFVAVQGRS